MFYVHPYLGKWSNLTNIFQMGWNHPLVMIMIEIYSLLDAVWQKGAQVPKNWCFSIVFVQHTGIMGGATFFCQKPIHHINMYSVYVDITSTYLSSHTLIYIYMISVDDFLMNLVLLSTLLQKKTQRNEYTSTIFSKKICLDIGDKLIPPLIGNPYSGYIHPYGIGLMTPQQPEVDSTHAVSYFVATLVAMAFVVLAPQGSQNHHSWESWRKFLQIRCFFLETT